MTIEHLKYPIGKFNSPKLITKDILDKWIDDITIFPEKLRHEVSPLNDNQLNTAYRPDGWTIRQVIHHCADSHMNIFIRIKLALTEDQPTIKPYFENRWAELPDTINSAVEPSLKIIEGIHERWVTLLKNLNSTQFGKTFVHPEHGKIFRIDESLGIYAWHCNHHLAHITKAKKYNHWD